ncbi:signal peptide peptidase SppA [candidate division KSB1 bacterium]
MDSQKITPSKKGINFIVGIFAIVGGLTVLGGFLFVIIILAFSGDGPVPDQTILEINFEKSFIEYVYDDPFSIAAFGSQASVRDIVDALERASEDKRVKGFVARVGGQTMGMAQIQEIRDAVIAFRKSGKPAVVFSETFGEMGPGNGSYYLSTAFDKIYLQPSGSLGLTGIMYEGMFLKGFFEKVGLVPRGDRRYEYKNAFDQFMQTEFTKYHEEALQAVMNSHFGQMLNGIAEGRNMEEQQVRTLFDNGPFLAREALDADLVDGLLYRDQVYDQLREEVGEGSQFLYLSKYLKRAGRVHKNGTKIALIYGVGTIMRGAGGIDPLSLEPSMGSEQVIRPFKAALKDPEVKAILFRVDSPGGSAIASDTIWREVARAVENDIPVIVSMGNVAGSGGYYIAMPATKIIAQPGTITGSIGAYGLKMLTNEIWEKLGITWDDISTSTNSTVWSTTHDYTPEQWDKLQQWLDNVYEDFTGKVAAGRGMSLEKVLEVAKGRIWTGEDALEHGLVDELGGFSTALDLIRDELSLEEDAPLNISLFPKPKSLFESFLAEGDDSSEPDNILARSVRSLQPVTDLLRQAGVFSNQGVLTMPGIYKIK